MDQQVQWPKKVREMQRFCIDSTYWNDFKFRDDDIIIATWAKSGTTWLQQIIANLIFNGETEGMPVGDMSPWLDFRLPPLEAKLPEVEAQTHRRFLKTHLPLDAFPYQKQVKHIYIGRDGRDCCWSMYNHHLHLNDVLYDGLKSLPQPWDPVIEPPHTADLREYYLDWFYKDGFPFWPFWENVRTWWTARNLPNMYFLHYQNLKDDMEGQMRKIADFLEIPIDESKWEKIVYHCTFDYMKENATLSTPLGGAIFDGGAAVFVNRGENGRWQDVLTDEDKKQYEARAIYELGEECAHWLATGEFSKK